MDLIKLFFRKTVSGGKGGTPPPPAPLQTASMVTGNISLI
jgi:hypothetical protein